MNTTATFALRRFEEALGGRLPADVRHFLVGGAAERWVGGFAAPEGWPGASWVRLRRFFGLTERPERGIERATFVTYAGRVPDVAIPVAACEDGGVVVVGYDGLDAGRVWLCDRARSATASRAAEMRAAIAREGVSATADHDEVLWYWERLFPGERPWRLGFADVYPVAGTFSGFLAAIG